MSGPIIRKYGFPNFDQIFGKKELEHGVEPSPTPEEAKKPEPTKEEPPKTEAPKSS